MSDLPNQASSGVPAFVSYEVRGGVAGVMLDRPDYASSQNCRMLGQLDDLYHRAVEDAAVKVIVLRGKRAAMDSVFHLHHLAHAHNQPVSGSLTGGKGAKEMASAGKKQAGEG